MRYFETNRLIFGLRWRREPDSARRRVGHVSILTGGEGCKPSGELVVEDLFLTPVFVLVVAKGLHAGTAFSKADGVDTDVVAENR